MLFDAGEDRTSFIGTAIINDDDFLGDGDFKNASYNSCDGLFFIVNRYHDRQFEVDGNFAIHCIKRVVLGLAKELIDKLLGSIQVVKHLVNRADVARRA